MMNTHPFRSGWATKVAAVAALLCVGVAASAQIQRVTRTAVWPSAEGDPKVDDRLEVKWQKHSTETKSFGTKASMELSFDHRDRDAVRAMDLVVRLEVVATLNNDLGRYDSRADRDSMFTLEYRIGRRSKGVALAAKTHPDSLLSRKLDAVDRQLFTCTNAHRLTFKLVEVKVDEGDGFRTRSELPTGVRFDGSIEWEFIPKINPATVPDLNSPVVIDCENDGADELLVSWGPITSAYSYQLEWTWVDDYHEDGLTSIVPDYDLARNATRVSINAPQTYYSIPLLFDRGYLVYRVRAMGQNVLPPYPPVYGAWSMAEATGSVSDVPGASYHIMSGHRADVNWQFTTSFAEEGKRKEVMTYADGTLRSRQAVTRNNSLNVPIIGETFYDAVGRPAVEAMPVPMVRDQGCPVLAGDPTWAPIDLYPRFNQADPDADNDPSDNDQEDYQYFHMLAQPGDDCGAGAVPFHPQNGAELYYHEEHLSVPDALTGSPGFLPKAEGFPFTQTEFTRDNTGRLRRKSGVGDAFKLGSDHETTMLYGKPEQIKLDRLFGSEAGYASHYQKNVTLDGNGQASVAYLDRAGRTVATALAGGARDEQLENLGSFSDPVLAPMLETDLFCGQPSTDCEANDLDPDVPALVFRDQIVVPANGLNYAFTYTMEPGVVSILCLDEGICLQCVYELTISLVDQCGVELLAGAPTTIGSFTEEPGGALSFSCTPLATHEHPEMGPIVLNAGEYTLTKILRVSSAAREAYVADLTTSGSGYLAPGCFSSLEDLIAGYTGAIDVTDCDVTCADCVIALGTLEDFILNGGTEQDFNQLLEQCNAPCEADSWCDVAYQAMLVDMTIGGQYASISIDGDGNTSADDRTSVFYHEGDDLPSVLTIRAYEWQGLGLGYQYAPLEGVVRDIPLWRQPRLLDEDGTYLHQYLTQTGNRFSITVESIDGEWSPAVDDDSEVYPDGSGGWITYPENLATLELFVSYWQPGFERSLLFYHPEYCYWLDCKGYSDIPSENDSWSSDDFDSALLLATLTDAQNNNWINLTAPVGQRVLFLYDASTDQGYGYPSGDKHDPFVLNPSVYGSVYVDYLLGKVDAYKPFPNTTMLSMEAFAAVMGGCPGTTDNPSAACMDFLGPGFSPEQREAQWEAYKRFYFSEKYRAQKRHADAAVASCASGCSGLNLCIGQGEDDDWMQRMQSPVMTITPPWYIGGTLTNVQAAIYSIQTSIFSQAFGRPIVQGCQVCSDANHDYFVNKVPRVPDPEQFPGMNMSPEEMAAQAYQTTGDCPVAAAWRTMFEERVLHDQLTSTGIDLDGQPQYSAWAGLTIAQNGQGTPVPDALWSGTPVGNTLNFSVDGCNGNLTLSDPSVLSTYSYTFVEFLDAIFAVPGIEAQSATSFILHVQFVDASMVPHATTLTGSVCNTYNLITCNFPPVATGNQFAEDLEDLLSIIASAEGDLLSGTGVNLSTTPVTAAVAAAPPDVPNAIPAGPMIQTMVPDFFLTGAWNDDLIWSFDGGSNFTLASGVDGCPRYVIQTLNYQQAPGSTFTMADLDDIFEFRNMVSSGNNLFDVDVYSAPDWENGLAPQLLATLHGAVTFYSCSGPPEEPSLGSFGPMETDCSGPDVELMQALYESLGHFMTLSPAQLSGTYDLTTSPYMTPELEQILYDTHCFGNSCPVPAWGMSPVIFPGGPVVDDNDYKMIAFGPNKCPIVYYPQGFLNGTAQTIPHVFSSAIATSFVTENGLSNAFTFHAYSSSGQQLTELPIVVYAPCMEFEVCDPCPLDGSFSPGPAATPVVPNQPASLMNPCSDWIIGPITDFNNSIYSDIFGVDLIVEPGWTNMIFQQGLCPCLDSYAAHLQPYIDWDGTGTAPPGEVVQPADWAPCGVVVEEGDCEEAYEDYLAAVADFETWLQTLVPQPTQHIQVAPASVFTNELACYCVQGYISDLEHAMLDGVLSSAEANDEWLWHIAMEQINGPVVHCAPPVPCEPVFPLPTPIVAPPPGSPCDSLLYQNAIANANQAFQQQIGQLTADITNAYNTQCLNTLETFRMRFQDPEHHYTLYYYDQAGNLVRTVPPEGVQSLDIGNVVGGQVTGEATIAAIANDRATGDHTVFVDHRMPSDHVYNSLNNPIRLQMPDHDRMDIWGLSLTSGLPNDLRVTGSSFLGDKGYLSGWRNGPSGRTRGYVYRTQDGGASWQRSNGLLATGLRGVHFGGSTVGYAVGAFGSVVRTEDGGASWDLMTELTNRDVLFDDVDVLPTNDALVVGRRTGSNSPVVFKITPGLAISSGQTLNMNGFYDFTGVRGWLNGTQWWWYASINDDDNGTVGWATTQSGHFNLSTGSANIGSRSTMVTGNAISSGVGFMAGTSGALMKSTDGSGSAWKYVATATKADFVKVHFVDDDLGLAILNDPTGVLRWTTNGGRTWTDVDPAYTGLRDFHYTGLVGNVHEFFAVGDNATLVRVLLTSTSAAAYPPSQGPTGELRSVYADRSSGGLFMVVGRADGSVSGTPDLNAGTVAWHNLTVGGASPISDLVMHTPTGNPDRRHGLFLAQNGRLYQNFFDLLQPLPWGVLHQFTFAPTQPHRAIALRSDGIASVSRASGSTSLSRIELVDLNVLTVSFLSQASLPNLANQSATIQGMFFMGANSNVVMSIGSSAPTNSGSVGLHAGIYSSAVSGTGTYTTTLVDRRLSIKGSLRLNDYAKGINAVCGDQGTIMAPFPGGSAVNWYVAPTPVLNDMNGIAAYGNLAGQVFAVGDGGKAFIMQVHLPGTFTPVQMPTTADLLDVAVNGQAITISATNGLMLHCPDFASDPTFTLLPYTAGDIPGVTVKDGHTFAVGDAGLVHRLLGTLRMPVHEVFTPRLNDVHFSDDQHGYTVGNNQVARYTADGGASWNVVGIKPTISSAYNASTSPPVRNFNAVFSDTPGHALAVGTGSLNADFSNSTWGNNPPYSGLAINFNDVAMTPSGAQIMVGGVSGSGRIVRRTNSSSAWVSEAALPTGTTLNTIWTWPSYFDTDNGVAREDVLIGGDQSTVRLRRFSNGAWTAPATTVNGLPGAALNIRCFWFHDQITGFAAGTGGVIHETTPATTLNHGNFAWENGHDPVEPEYLGQNTATNATILTMAFSDRHRGFFGGTYSGTTPGYARTVHDESNLYSQRMWYDQLGRVILSQNTKQFNAEPKRYSYSLYDNLGRVHEAGELRDGDGSLPSIFGMDVNGMFKPEVINYPVVEAWVESNPERYEVVRSHYDEEFGDPAIMAEFGPVGQENLRLRVAHVTYIDKIPDDGDVLTYDHASHYSYDIHGNVKKLVQEHMQLGEDQGGAGNPGRFKRIDYTYDLISGNVKEVHYQDGEPDQFHHRYTYDADNRIQRVETSRNDDVQAMWRTDAIYHYYPHGPLRRVEIGDLQVQGVDYAYTLQGWLKGINSDLLLPSKDMGSDALAGGDHQYVGRDVYGLSLGYYGETDYVALNETTPDQGPFATIGGQVATDMKQLYNGNIAHTVNSLAPFTGYTGTTGEIGQPLAMVYKYDQLNRLRQARGYTGLTTGNSWLSATDPVTDRYFSEYTYDANGNIETTDRKDEAGQAYDQMEYAYHDEGTGRQRNRLYHIKENNGHVGDDYPQNLLDGETDPTLLNDPTGTSNYRYDAIGNLIYDQVNGINEITWTATAKVRKVAKDDSPSAKNLEFAYDASGNRVLKNVTSTLGVTEYRDHYVRDANGDIMAIYRYSAMPVASLEIRERPIYGSNRMGSDSYRFELIASPPYDPNHNPIGLVHYEMTDQLGNVASTVTDEVFLVDEAQDELELNDFYSPVIVSAQGYEPFGSVLPGRSQSTTPYRLGFQGQEKEELMSGSPGMSYFYKYRVHDPRTGRFFSIDPLASKYPHNSTYAFSENRVIDGVELEGLEVLLIGQKTSAGVFLGGNVEYGIAVGPNGTYMYATTGLSLSTSVSVAAQIAVTYFPTMPRVQMASGWGYSAGVSGGEGVTGSGAAVYSSGYGGYNFAYGVGGGFGLLTFWSVEAGASYTTLAPLSDLAKIETGMDVLHKVRDFLKDNIADLSKEKAQLTSGLVSLQAEKVLTESRIRKENVGAPPQKIQSDLAAGLRNVNDRINESRIRIFEIDGEISTQTKALSDVQGALQENYNDPDRK